MDVFEEKWNILEPAGALALTGAEAYCKHYELQGENIVVITSGANMNFDKLRVVTKLANIGHKQEVALATVMAEELGSFKQFYELVGQMNVTKFKYRCNSNEKAVVLYNVGVHTASELRAIQERMESSQLKTYNLIESKVKLYEVHQKPPPAAEQVRRFPGEVVARERTKDFERSCCKRMKEPENE
ncbi:hypothetical protein JHK82_035593 [Glycine max]|nr:hypothetical protein JHK85_036319 [Glycine max]KAG5112324.1 hypothetical protein JHK82_035593 [Glycine max]KAG5129604.1 hypothetical protein JHK84_036001 [Glycine max]